MSAQPRHDRRLERQALRQLPMGQTLVVHALTEAAIKSARETCRQVGREQGCSYSASVYPRTSTLYDLYVVRRTEDDARRWFVKRYPQPSDPALAEERQTYYAAFFRNIQYEDKRKSAVDMGYSFNVGNY